MPTYTTNTGAGTNAKVTINGNDEYGCITLVTGSNCASNGVVLSVSFDKPWNSGHYKSGQKPKAVILTPANANAASLMNTIEYKQQVFVPCSSLSNTDWEIKSNSTSLNDVAVYSWFYEVK